ncbi:MAG TPA: protein-disulfide reductase DsbD domain-containing protein [Bauldia sp.]|nr:protein-disulfide reductase DsbD domain-containing protein [Bauldia sp.]
MKRTGLTLLLLAAGATPSLAAFGAWVDGERARVRLIAAAVDAEGHVSAGLQIELDPDWKTYWRSPGDAGIAPVLDFTSSTNIGAVTVRYPVPERHDDGFTVTNVYEDRVTLPLAADVPDPKSPGVLRVKLDIGVCAEVCIPEHFEASVAFSPAMDDRVVGEELSRAAAGLPGPAIPGVFSVERVWKSGGTDKRPEYSFDATLPEAGNAQIFVEGPGDWYAGVPVLLGEKGKLATFQVTFDRARAKTPEAGARLRFTIISSGRAIEQTVALD